MQKNILLPEKHTIPHGTINAESYFINVNREDRLHLKRLYSREDAVPLLMLHGSIENGGIFYSKSLKGSGAVPGLQWFRCICGRRARAWPEHAAGEQKFQVRTF